MRGSKAKRLRKLGLKSGPAPRPEATAEHTPIPFDHARERRSSARRPTSGDIGPQKEQ